MSTARTSPFVVQSNARFFTGMFITPVSIMSIVVILTFSPYPLLALFPIPTLMIGTAMTTLELRNRIDR